MACLKRERRSSVEFSKSEPHASGAERLRPRPARAHSPFLFRSRNPDPFPFRSKLFSEDNKTWVHRSRSKRPAWLCRR